MFSIYQVIKKLGQDSYIGFTTENPPEKRWAAHQAEARRGSPYHFHKAIRKYGADEFTFKLLEIGENEEYGLKIAEPMYIAWLKPKYNMTVGGEAPMKNKKHTEETKIGMSVARKGTKHTEAQRLARSTWMKGNQNPLGTRRTEESKEKMRGNQNAAGPNGPQIRITCPNCQKSGGTGNMKRYHFNNCKGKI